jgi:hypothetical protein
VWLILILNFCKFKKSWIKREETSCGGRKEVGNKEIIMGINGK